MRRVISILLTLALMIQLSVFAESVHTISANAAYHAATGNVVIAGKTDGLPEDSEILILTVDKDIPPVDLQAENIHYMDACYTEADGTFQIKFNIGINRDFHTLKAWVKQVTSDITYTLDFTAAETLIDIDSHYSAGKMYVNMRNNYADETDILLVAATYDQDGKLLSADSKNEHINYSDFCKDVYFDFAMPQNAVIYKVFAWKDFETLQPLSNASEKYYYNANASVLDIYSEKDIQETAEELFENINSASPDIQHIYAEYQHGNYLNALALFRNSMIDNLRKTPADIQASAWNDSYQNTVSLNLLDTMVGYMTLDEANGGVRTTVDQCNVLDFIDSSQPSHCDWIICDETLPMGGTLLLDNFRHGFTGLAIRYMQTGDEIYAKKLVQLMEDYAMNYQPQSDAHFGLSGTTLENRSMSSINISRHTDFNDVLIINDIGSRADSYNVSRGQRANSFFFAMSFLAKALPSEKFTHSYSNTYPAVLSTMSFSDKLSDDAYNTIDPVRWAKWVNHLVEWELPVVCGSVLNCSGGTTNITSSSYQAALRYMALLKDFNIVGKYQKDLFKHIDTFYAGSTHNDGVYIEKAFSYNISEAENRLVTANVIENIVPEWYHNLYDFSENREKWNRVVKICTSPLGLLSHVGNYAGPAGTQAIWTNSAEKERFAEKVKVSAEAYTSAYLPYGGLGSFRSGWGIDDLYMSFFVNSDRYAGHSFTATNAIMNLTAYGRTMLISGGMPWYGRSYVKGYTDFLESGYDEINGYMGETSSKKVSTVLVNGKSQENTVYDFDDNGMVTSTYGARLSKAKAETLGGRWISDTEFDYAEGIYDNAYTVRDTTESIIPDLTDSAAITRDAIHKRGFIFVRNAGLWIVTDEMENRSDSANQYSAMWHFAAYEEGNKMLTGFKNEQVITDETENVFFTKDAGKLNYDTPNLFVYNFSAHDLSYKKYYGHYNSGDRQAFGWSFGGNDITTGKYAKRPEVHVEWTDHGKGDISQVAAVLIPSPDKNTKLLYKVDNSEGDKTEFEIGLKNGYIITYISNPNGEKITLGNHTIQAKTVVTVQKNALSSVDGLALDCESIDGVLEDSSFTFTINSTKIIKRQNISRPMD